MSFRVPVRPATNAQLDKWANPSAVAGGQNEAVPWVLYCTQDMVTDDTLLLNFFQTLHADKSLGNMELAGMLPDPQFFQAYYFGLDVLMPVADAAVPAAWDEMHTLVLTGRGYWTFVVSDKNYGPFPVSFLHASGGVTGFGYNAAAAALTATEFANNGTFDGGWCVDGAHIIPPKVGFKVTMQWPAVTTLTATTKLRMWIAGVLHRRVL